jgi:hypothetical protein
MGQRRERPERRKRREGRDKRAAVPTDLRPRSRAMIVDHRDAKSRGSLGRRRHARHTRPGAGAGSGGALHPAATAHARSQAPNSRRRVSTDPGVGSRATPSGVRDDAEPALPRAVEGPPTGARDVFDPLSQEPVHEGPHAGKGTAGGPAEAYCRVVACMTEHSRIERVRRQAAPATAAEGRIHIKLEGNAAPAHRAQPEDEISPGYRLDEVAKEEAHRISAGGAPTSRHNHAPSSQQVDVRGEASGRGAVKEFREEASEGLGGPLAPARVAQAERQRWRKSGPGM